MACTFDGKVAMITGSGRGIGEAMAVHFASQGASVVLADMDFASAAAAADGICQRGGRAIAVRLDVANRDDVDAGVREALETYGRVDILVNNAAINFFTAVEEVTDAEWDAILGVNVRGVYNCTRGVIPSMKSNKWGRIVNISSSAGKMGGPISSIHYSASKAAVICMTKSFAMHLAASNITVNSVCPGVVGTDMVRLLPDAARARAIETIPLRRFAEPAEIARAAAFLCSDDASYITGEVLDVNGGTVMD